MNSFITVAIDSACKEGDDDAVIEILKDTDFNDLEVLSFAARRAALHGRRELVSFIVSNAMIDIQSIVDCAAEGEHHLIVEDLTGKSNRTSLFHIGLGLGIVILCGRWLYNRS